MNSSLKLFAVMTIAAISAAVFANAQDTPPPAVGVPAAPPTPIVAEPADVDAAEAVDEQIEEEKARLDAELEKAEQAIVEIRGSDAVTARKQLAQTRAQVDRQRVEARQAILLAQAQVAAPAPIPAPHPVNPGIRNRLNAIVGKAPSRALIVRFDALDPASQSTLEEDLAVMSRVLERSVVQSLGDEDGPKASGIQVLFSPEGASSRNVYLEGYGALFTLNVRFPLLAPEKKAEEEKPKESVDSTWEDARRDLYGEHDQWKAGDMFRFDWHGGEPQEYDAGKVERLRKALLEGLKSATNIRGLKPDDWVSVVVFGGATPTPTRLEVVKPGAKPDPKSSRRVRDERTKSEVVVVEDPAARARNGSVLAIRVKRSEVEDFAKGRIDADQFARKVSVATYPADTGGWSSDFRFF